MLLLPQRNKPVSTRVFNLLQTKLLYMFFSSFEPFILVGLQRTVGLPYLMPIFAGNASLYSTVVACFSSVIFVGSYEVIFSEK